MYLWSEVDSLWPAVLRENVRDECPIDQVRGGEEIDGMVGPEAAVAEGKVDAGTVTRRYETLL